MKKRHIDSKVRNSNHMAPRYSKHMHAQDAESYMDQTNHDRMMDFIIDFSGNGNFYRL